MTTKTKKLIAWICLPVVLILSWLALGQLGWVVLLGFQGVPFDSNSDAFWVAAFYVGLIYGLVGGVLLFFWWRWIVRTLMRKVQPTG